MQMTKIDARWLVAAFLMVGLLADLMPHPILGESLLTSTLNQFFLQEGEQY